MLELGPRDLEPHSTLILIASLLHPRCILVALEDATDEDATDEDASPPVHQPLCMTPDAPPPVHYPGTSSPFLAPFHISCNPESNKVGRASYMS